MDSNTKQILTEQYGIYDDIINVISDITSSMIIKPHPIVELLKEKYDTWNFEDHCIEKFFSTYLYNSESFSEYAFEYNKIEYEEYDEDSVVDDTGDLIRQQNQRNNQYDGLFDILDYDELL